MKKKADQQNTTLSEEIRKILDKDLSGSEKKQNAGSWLLSMAKEAEKLGMKGPKDLASNVDKYLYGQE